LRAIIDALEQKRARWTERHLRRNRIGRHRIGLDPRTLHVGHEDVGTA
jgi:hypothetical protein